MAEHMVKEKTWKEFKEAGLLWWINNALYIFGWCIVYNYEDGKLIEVYPARTKFRGQCDRINTEGYKKVSKYMLDNVEELLKEANE